MKLRSLCTRWRFHFHAERGGIETPLCNTNTSCMYVLISNSLAIIQQRHNSLPLREKGNSSHVLYPFVSFGMRVCGAHGVGVTTVLYIHCVD